MPPESRPHHEVETTPYPTLSELGERYNYHPAPNETYTIDLGIDWDKAPVADFSTTLQAFNTTLPDTRYPRHDYNAILHTNKIPSHTTEPIFLAIRRYLETDLSNQVTTAFLKVEARNPVKPITGNLISALDFKYTTDESSEQWNLTHREVDDYYRNQGIASGLLAMVEQGLVARAESTQKSQTITINIGQASVLLFFLKRGYRPRRPEDAKRLNQFLQGDDTLTITSSPILHDSEKIKHWYIFEKKKLPEPGTPQYQALWQRYAPDGEANYIKRSFRIELAKKLA